MWAVWALLKQRRNVHQQYLQPGWPVDIARTTQTCGHKGLPHSPPGTGHHLSGGCWSLHQNLQPATWGRTRTQKEHRQKLCYSCQTFPWKIRNNPVYQHCCTVDPSLDTLPSPPGDNYQYYQLQAFHRTNKQRLTDISGFVFLHLFHSLAIMKKGQSCCILLYLFCLVLQHIITLRSSPHHILMWSSHCLELASWSTAFHHIFRKL